MDQPFFYEEMEKMHDQVSAWQEQRQATAHAMPLPRRSCERRPTAANQKPTPPRLNLTPSHPTHRTPRAIRCARWLLTLVSPPAGPEHQLETSCRAALARAFALGHTRDCPAWLHGAERRPAGCQQWIAFRPVCVAA
jgi:hypothetical protein